MWNYIRRIFGRAKYIEIEVDLNIKANPPVIVARDTTVTNQRVKWVKKANNSFDFHGDSMADLDSGKFPSANVSSDVITCRNKFKAKDKSEYTIVVEDANGCPYNSTETVPGGGDAGGGKPVIRN